MRPYVISLKEVLEKNNKYSSKKKGNKPVGCITRELRQNMLFHSFRLLWGMGYKLKDVRDFKGRHVEALLQYWKMGGYADSTIQDYMSILRVFSVWIGKEGMVETITKYDALKGKVLAAQTSNAWSDRGVDIEKKVAEIKGLDERVGLCIELCWRFGLRPREAWCLKPGARDCGAYLDVVEGTKGGRARKVSITTKEQRELLDRVKKIVAEKNRSLIPKKYTLKMWRDRFYNVCRKAGLTRKDGIWPHGCRHEYANEMYEEITGVSSPVRDREANRMVAKDLDDEARLKISHSLGHSRKVISGAYLGSRYGNPPVAIPRKVALKMAGLP